MDETDDTPGEGTESSHEQMQRYEELATRQQEYGNRKREVLDSVGEELSAALERAIGQTGANVVVEATASSGTTQTLGVRLDRAALIACVCDELPDGFTIDSLNDDGTLTVEWSRRTDQSKQQRAGTILKAIIAEEVTTDTDNLIESVPSRERVLDRAREFDIDETMASQRLERLQTLDIVDVENESVYPGSNFSRI